MAETKVITLEELKEHTKKDDLYVLLHGKGKQMLCERLFFASVVTETRFRSVYAVSKFIDEV